MGRFEIATGAAIDLLKSFVCECRSVVEQSSSPFETESDVALKRGVYDLVCALRDNWRAHVEEELASEQRVQQHYLNASAIRNEGVVAQLENAPDC